jgi:HD-GYP domain-containing protein (c-di-GMP phosphodiesterase class II)
MAIDNSSYALLPVENAFSIQPEIKAPVDLYVYLSTSGQYLLLIHKNELVSESKFKQYQQLLGKNLYVKQADLNKLMGVAEEVSQNATLESLLPNEIFNKEVLGQPAQRALKTAYEALISSSTKSGSDPTEALKELSDKILKVILPEVYDQKVGILKQLKNITYMNHASAICSLAVLAALANDFNSKTSLEALTRATLLMDASLVEIDDETLEAYYKNREELPSHVLEKIKTHPLKSQQLVAYLPIANEIVNQLILTHHELHNGKGYHRGVRSGGVLMLGQVLSFAVDWYEKLKSEFYEAENFTIRMALDSFKEKHVEPHKRRHSEKLVRNVIKYMDLEEKA